MQQNLRRFNSCKVEVLKLEQLVKNFFLLLHLNNGIDEEVQSKQGTSPTSYLLCAHILLPYPHGRGDVS